jgi:hypothetical protein
LPRARLLAAGATAQAPWFRWPTAGRLGLGFFAGVFGASRPIYIRNEITDDDDGNEVAVYDNCDADAYCDGGSSDSRGD